MDRVRYVATEDSLDFARKLAEGLGLDFDREAAAADAPFLLSVYYCEAIGVLGEAFSSIEIADFSRRTIDAYAARSRQGRAYLHVDQHFDFWMFGLCLLWTEAALVGVPKDKEETFDALFLALLDLDCGIGTHEEIRERVSPWIEGAGNRLRVAHDLSVACFLSVVCHELAHHSLGHLNMDGSWEVELEADREGFKMIQRLFADPRSLDLIPHQPYSLAAPWVVLNLIDASERRAAQRAGERLIHTSSSHPPARNRLAVLAPLMALVTDRSPQLASFAEGYNHALRGIFEATGLATIETP